MTPDTINAITEHLMKMELSQIEACKKALLALIDERKQKQQEAALKRQPKPHKPGSLPPTYSDINQLAEMQGLDLSGLMKEISRK